MPYITIRLHNGATLSGGAAKLLIGYVLRRRGRPCWEEIGVDLFTGGGETMAIARPRYTVSVRLADYALPILYQFFQE